MEDIWVIIAGSMIALLLVIYYDKLKHTEKVLITVPVFMLIGCLINNIHTNKISIGEKYNDTDSIEIEGRIDDIVEKEKTYQLKLYDTKDTESKYNLGKVLLYISKDKFDDKKIMDNANNLLNMKIMAKGEIKQFERSCNEGQFDMYEYYCEQNSYVFMIYADKVELIDNEKISVFKKFLYRLDNLVSNVRNSLKDNIFQIYDDKNAGIISALILGDKNSLDSEVKELYQKNGISHILAISGLHISFVGMGIYKILQKTGLSKRNYSIISILILLFYAYMTNFSLSTCRATIMLICMISAGVTGRSYDVYNSMCFSLFFALIQNPKQIYSAGMLLSYLAVIGVCLIGPVLNEEFFNMCDYIYIKVNGKSQNGLERDKDKLHNSEKLNNDKDAGNRLKDKKGLNNEKNNDKSGIIKIRINKETGEFDDDSIIIDIKDILRKFMKFIVSSLLSGLAINLITLPVILYYYYEVSVTSILLNIIVIPLLTYAIVMSFASVFVTYLSPGVGVFCSGIVNYIFDFYEFLCELMQKIDIGYICTGRPAIWKMACFYILLIIYIMSRRLDLYEFLKDKYKEMWSYGVIAIVIILGAVLFIDTRPNGLRIVMLDVGQGDCFYIETKNGTNYMIDCGSTQVTDLAKYRIKPFLKYNGKKSIDYVFLTHMDNDHISGILEIYEQELDVEIKNLILPYSIKHYGKNESYESLLQYAKKNGTKVAYISEGNTMGTKELTFRCLHPGKMYEPESENSYSTVLWLKYGDFDMLFTGDLEADGEKIVADLIKEAEYNVNFEILKVSHHGSKNSSIEEFLEIIKPQIAVISAGKDNSYGHPHNETIERLENTGSEVMSTIESGMVEIMVGKEIVINGKHMNLITDD